MAVVLKQNLHSIWGIFSGSEEDLVWIYEPSAWVYIIPERKWSNKLKFTFQLGMWAKQMIPICAPRFLLRQNQNPSSRGSDFGPSIYTSSEGWQQRQTLVTPWTPHYCGKSGKEQEQFSWILKIATPGSGGDTHIQTILKQKRSHKFHSPRQSIQYQCCLPCQSSPSRTSPEPKQYQHFTAAFSECPTNQISPIYIRVKKWHQASCHCTKRVEWLPKHVSQRDQRDQPQCVWVCVCVYMCVCCTDGCLCALKWKCVCSKNGLVITGAVH